MPKGKRVGTHYNEFLADNLGTKLVGESVHEFMQHILDLPEDTAAWVLGGVA